MMGSPQSLTILVRLSVTLIYLCVVGIYAQDPEENNCHIFDINICDCYDMCHTSGHPTINGCSMEVLQQVPPATRESCGIRGNFEQNNNPFNIFPPDTPGLIGSPQSLVPRQPPLFGPQDISTSLQGPGGGQPVSQQIFGPQQRGQNQRNGNGLRYGGLRGNPQGGRQRGEQQYGIQETPLDPPLGKPPGLQTSSSDRPIPSLLGPLGSQGPQLSLQSIPPPEEIRPVVRRNRFRNAGNKRLSIPRNRPLIQRSSSDGKRTVGRRTEGRFSRPLVKPRRQPIRKRFRNSRFPKQSRPYIREDKYGGRNPNNRIRENDYNSRRSPPPRFPLGRPPFNNRFRPPPPRIPRPFRKPQRSYPLQINPQLKSQFLSGQGDVEQPTQFPLGGGPQQPIIQPLGGLPIGGPHQQVFQQPIAQPLPIGFSQNQKSSLTVSKVENLLQEAIQKMTKQHTDALEKAAEKLAAAQKEIKRLKSNDSTTNEDPPASGAKRKLSGIQKEIQGTTAILSVNNKLRVQRRISRADGATQNQIKTDRKSTSEANEKYIYAYCEMSPNVALPNTKSNITGRIDIRQRITGGDIGPAQIRINLGGFDVTDRARVHGLHVHEFGDLSGGCASAGAHYNPFNRKHGGPLNVERHVGDLGNLVHNENGNVFVFFSDKLISLVGPQAILGRTIVVHAQADDFGLGGDEESLRTGNAGERLACCVIGQTSDDRWTKNKP